MHSVRKIETMARQGSNQPSPEGAGLPSQDSHKIAENRPEPLEIANQMCLSPGRAANVSECYTRVSRAANFVETDKLT